MKGFINTFKYKGVRWVIRGYHRNGKQKYCYSPNRGYEPIFVDKKLTDDEFKAIVEKQNEKWRKISEGHL